MPVYLYQNPRTGQVKEVVQRMTEAHEYSEGGAKWNRVFTNPQAKVPLCIDPFSEKDFVKKTGERRGTVGDLWDLSAELSHKREQMCGGTDPIKQKTVTTYEKKTQTAHPLKASNKARPAPKVKLDL